MSRCVVEPVKRICCCLHVLFVKLYSCVGVVAAVVVEKVDIRIQKTH